MSYATLARKTASVAPAPKSAAAVSTSLRIGEPNDSFEQEADRIADEVMAGGRSGWSLSSMGIGGPLRRKCSCGGSGECEECKEKQNVQRKADGSGLSGYAPPVVNEVLRSPGRPLDSAARDFFEPRFRYDFGAVRIHTGAREAESAADIGALAYTVGDDIVLGANSPSLGADRSRRLLAHELVHVIQQGGAHDKSPGSAADRLPDDRSAAFKSFVRQKAVSRGGLIQRQLPNKQQIEEGAADIWRRGGFSHTGAGLLTAEIAWRSKGLAEKLEHESHLDGDINGPADAFRHCVLSCLLTAGTDAATAKIVTDTHEEKVPNKPNETKMDLHNNAVGMTCGTAAGRNQRPFWKSLPIPKGTPEILYHVPTKEEIDGCVSCTWQKLNSGALWVLSDWDKGAAASGDPIPEKFEKPQAGKPQTPTVSIDDLPTAQPPEVNVDDLPGAK